MKSKLLALLIILSVVPAFFAQLADDEVLFTVDDKEIKVGEFVKVYNKNIDLVKDESQKDVDAYLDLYINYQLKLKEAKRLELHKDVSYQREFTTYKNQLTKNFLADSEVTEKLIKEAYDRASYDLKGVHILIRMDETEQDTLSAYNRLVDLRKRLAKEDFKSLQAELHDGKEVYVEDLGYFTAFKMVYPFETAAYNTEVNEVSMPFRTRFGFHIVKILDRRKSRGEVKVAHIMVAKNDKDSLVDPKNRINEIYRKLNQGESFSTLAKQFSDDKSSAEKGGELAPFQGGQLSSMEFEDVAFSMENPDDVSQPFETAFGWHIIKLIDKRPLQTYEQMKPELEVKVKRDSRSNRIDSALIDQLKQDYNINKDQAQVTYFQGILNENFFNRKWVLPEDFRSDATIVTIDTLQIKNDEFGNFLISRQNSYYEKDVEINDLLKNELSQFIDQRLKAYHENNLENINEDFAFILQEYRDGLLLFDLMEKQIWNAAAKDSVGLQEFYNKNKQNYNWPERFSGKVITSSNKKDLARVVKGLEKGKNLTQLKDELNGGDSSSFIVTEGVFDVEHPLIPDNFDFKLGLSEAYQMNESYSIMMVDEVMPAGPKTLEEAKGKVISDYQTHLEDQWLASLRERYEVEVNDDVLTKVKIKLLN